MVKEYLRLTLFATGLLMGVQIPAFVDQYQKRVDAQLAEARLNMQGFQGTANKFFGGDVKQLLAHYQASDDPVFKADAANLAFVFYRVEHLQAHLVLLNQAGFFKPFYLVGWQDKDIMQDTLQQYSYLVPLSPEALVWGLTTALVFAFTLDLSAWGVRRTLRLKFSSGKS